MPTDLSALPERTSSIAEMRFGAMVTSPLGAGSQKIDRAGTRYRYTRESGRMKIEPHGRKWAALIQAATNDGARMRVKLDGFKAGAPGSPVVAADTASGREVPLAGLTPGYSIRAGQPVTVTRAGGRSYFDFARTNIIAASNGTATLTLQQLIRAPLVAGDKVELGAPFIEGIITEAFEFAQPLEGYTQFTVTIEEVA